MIGYIDVHGYIKIQRGQNLQEQLCQWNKEYFCCDKCVKFGEPLPIRNGNNEVGTAIRLCENTRLFFTEFSDNREK